METAVIVVLIILLICVMCWQPSAPERFDVYNNHPMGAQTVYSTTGVPGTGKVESLNMNDAERLARYTWKDKDPIGLNVYDRYYEDVVNVTKYADRRSFTAPDYYAYSDIGNGIGVNSVYDAKFHLYSGRPGTDNYTNFIVTGMADPDPLYMNFNGENIVMSQKNY
jgi:hypothetical protein